MSAKPQAGAREHGSSTSALDVLVLGMHYAPEATGNAPYTTGMARGLAAAGHRVRVVTGFPHYPQWSIPEGYRGLRMTERDGPIEVVRVRHPVPDVPTAGRRVLMDLVFSLHAAAARGPRPDVVVAVSPVLLTVAAALRWKRPGRTALGVVIQDLYSRALLETRMGSARSAKAAAWLERSLLARADGVAVVHENFVRNLGELRVPGDRVSVIRNWSHVASGTSDPAETRRRLGWHPDETIALHAGNMGAKQGLENVVEAARHAAGQPAQVRFVLLGDGGRRRHLEAIANDVERVTFLDPLPDGAFEDALSAADVLVLNEATSVTEMSAPSKLTSYFTAGRPVVAATARSSAASTEITRSGAGVRVDTGDPAALYDAVVELGRDPLRAAALGSCGRAYAAEHLSAGAAVAGYRRWVEDLAARR